MKDSIEAFAIRSVIASLTNAAMGGDWEANEQPSVLQVMGCDPVKARDVPVAMEMVALLVAAQEATARTARSLLAVADAANDQPTLDLLTQRLDLHEKTAWMLRSLLEE